VPGGAADLFRPCEAARIRPPRLVAVYGEDCERDRESARILGRAAPVTEWVVRCDVGRKVGHNSVFPLLLERRLGEFLTEMLSG
jgi:hypothetical protein